MITGVRVRSDGGAVAIRPRAPVVAGPSPTVVAFLKSGYPESNQGPSDYCMRLKANAPATEL